MLFLIRGVPEHVRSDNGPEFTSKAVRGDDTAGPILFFGGKGYIDFFCRLTEGVKGQRHVYYNSNNPPNAPGCLLKKFATRTRTNWHYECAKTVMAAHRTLCRESP